MQPVAHERLAGGRLRLGRLALVVGEDEVGAAAVEVDGGAELAQRQRAALDVPPGPARSPERVPRRLVVGRRLPEDEVQRVALVGVLGIAAVLLSQVEHLLPRVVAHLAEAIEAADAEVHRPAGLVGVPPVEHHGDEPADVGDGRRGPGLAERGEHVEGTHVGVEARRLLRGQVEVVHAELARLAQDVVVDVGDVAHALSPVAEVPQPPLQHVVGDVRGSVADVGGVIRRDAARVHGDDRPRLERHDLPPCRVIQAHHVGASTPVIFSPARVL